MLGAIENFSTMIHANIATEEAFFLPFSQDFIENRILNSDFHEVTPRERRRIDELQRRVG